MNKLNLLPPNIEQRNKARKLTFGLVLLQICIVIGVALLVIALRNAEGRTITRLYEIRNRVQAFDEGPVLLVLELDELRRIESNFYLFYYDNFPQTFCASWVTTVLDTQPRGGSVNRIGFDSMEFFFAGEVGNIDDAEQHRQNLLYHGFYSVNLGRINLMPNGRFEYELRIVVAYEER